MKLVFGDLQSKTRMEQDLRNQAKFEKQVTQARTAMESFVNLPDEDARIWDYPRYIRHFPIGALREAANRIRKARQS